MARAVNFSLVCLLLLAFCMEAQASICSAVLAPNLSGDYLLTRADGAWPRAYLGQSDGSNHYGVRLELILKSDQQMIYQIMRLEPYLDPKVPRRHPGEVGISYHVIAGRDVTHFDGADLIVFRDVPGLDRVVVSVEDSTKPSPFLLKEHLSLTDVIQHSRSHPVFVAIEAEADGDWIRRIRMQKFSSEKSRDVQLLLPVESKDAWFEIELMNYNDRRPQPIGPVRTIRPEMRSVDWSRVAGNLSKALLTADNLDEPGNFMIDFADEISPQEMSAIVKTEPYELWGSAPDSTKAKTALFHLSIRAVLDLLHFEKDTIKGIALPGFPPLHRIQLYPDTNIDKGRK